MTLKITNEIVCVICGGVNAASMWIGLPVHSTCSLPSEISTTYKGYSALAGLSNKSLHDLCRQLNVKFTYKYWNAGGKMSRLFHDRSWLIYQIVQVKGSKQESASDASEQGTEQDDGTEQGTEDDATEADLATDAVKAQEQDAGKQDAPQAPQDAPQAPQTAPTFDISPISAWVEIVQRCRDAAVRKGLKVTISPRASYRGAAMLARGIDLGNVAALEIGNRMQPQEWEALKHEAGITVPKSKSFARKAGKHKQYDLLLRLVKAGIPVWLFGGPAGGKSTIAEQIATELALPFYFTGAIDTAFSLTGFVDAQGRIVNTQFRTSFTSKSLFLFDEVDRSLPNAVLPFNAMLANGWGDFPGNTEITKVNPDWRVLVGANTNGAGATAQISGALKQDDAFRDRFAMLDFGYDTDLELELAHLAARNAHRKGVL